MVVTQEELHGRSREVTSAVTITLDPSQRLWLVNMTAGGQQVRMPDATLLGKGGVHFMVAMRTGSSTVTIADNGGNAITTSDGTSLLEALTRGLVLLIDNSTANGVWVVKKDVIATAQNPTPAEFMYAVGGTETIGSQAVRIRRYNHQLDSWLAGTSKTNNLKQGGGYRVGTTGLVVHGNNASPRNKVEHYDPDVWTVKADSPRNHQEFAAASVGVTATKGYAIGGLLSTTFQDTDEHTLVGDTWALRATLPQELRSTGVGVSDGTYLYVLWGQIDSGGNNAGVHYRYDPVANTYAAMANSPSQFLEDFGACCFLGHILKVGGRSPTSDQVHLYEIATNVWLEKLAFPLVADPIEPTGPGMAAPEGVPILCGGSYVVTGGNEARTYRWNRLTDVWTRKTDMLAEVSIINNQCIVATP